MAVEVGLLLGCEVVDLARDLAVHIARVEHQHLVLALRRSCRGRSATARRARCGCRRSWSGWRSSRRRRRSRPACAAPPLRHGRRCGLRRHDEAGAALVRSGSCGSTKSTGSWRCETVLALLTPGRPKGRRRSSFTFLVSTLSTLNGGLAITKSHLPHSGGRRAGGARLRRRCWPRGCRPPGRARPGSSSRGGWWWRSSPGRRR